MRGVLVALDLETTGLDPADSHIIEIGAVRFQNGEILDQLDTLVNPGVVIPPRITDITGIRDMDVANAPKLQDVLLQFALFVGDAPVVGHNVDFDLRFVRKQGIMLNNGAIDTYELASVLMPTVSRYNLNALMQALNISPEGHHHRALSDAIGAARVYMSLWEQLVNVVPVELVREIAALAHHLPSWRGLLPFEAAVKVREGERTAKTHPIAKALSREIRKSEPLRPAPQTRPLDPAEDASLLARTVPEGGTSDPTHLEMLRLVEGALGSNWHLLVEAPGDDKKLLSVLLPAALWAQRNGERIVVAAGSAALRHRLVTQYLPAVQQVIGSDPLRVAVMRGRSDYLCLARFETMRRGIPVNVEELRLLAKTLIWLSTVTDIDSLNDAERLSIRGPGEYMAWARLNANADGCAGTRCESQYGGRCPLFQARQAAESAHVVVVDHGLLVTDPLSHDPALPAFRRIFVLEPHRLEELVTEALHTRLDASGIKRQVAELGAHADGPPRGLLGDILDATHSVLPAKPYTSLEAGIQAVAEAALNMTYHVDSLFRALIAFLETVADMRPGDFPIWVRLTPEVRSKPAFGQVRAAWSILGQFTQTIAQVLPQLAARLNTLREKYALSPQIIDLAARVEGVGRELTRIHGWFQDCIAGSAENAPGGIVYWAEVSPDPDRTDRLTMHSAPQHVGPLLARYVWERSATVVGIDNALRVNDSFEYLKQRLGADHFVSHVITDLHEASRAILVFLPTDLPDANERERHQKTIERTIIELATTTGGHLLALFTGFAALRGSSQNISARLKLGDIAVFDQSDGTSQAALLEGFRSAEKGVLLGIRGFWDDVDFDERDLSTLVIVRLPFAVPNEPVFAARADTYERTFDQYTVPHAVMRFRQSVERLVKGRRRRGVVVVLDRRVTAKEYGQVFIDSLPPATIRRAPLGELAAAAREWLLEDNR